MDPALAHIWQGKTMSILVGFPPGGGIDTWARLVARHYSQFLPGNPAITVENIPGARGIAMANRLHESSPDGLTIGIHERDIPGMQLQGESGVRYDVAHWTWLGSLSVEQYVLGVHGRSGVTGSNLDLLKSRSIKTANVSPGDLTHRIGVALKVGLGWNLIPLFGFQGERENLLALDRGETNGIVIRWATVLAEKPDDLAGRIVIPVVQFGGRRLAERAGEVPTAGELFKDASPQARQVLAYVEAPLQFSRAVSTPPGADPAVTATMRAAFEQMMLDPGLLADADHIRLDVVPITGERVQSGVAEFMRTNPATLRAVDEQIHLDRGT